MNPSSFSAIIFSNWNYSLELPIDDKELATIISALHLGGDTSLFQKLKIVKEIREEYPGGPYKKIIREKYGMVI